MEAVSLIAVSLQDYTLRRAAPASLARSRSPSTKAQKRLGRGCLASGLSDSDLVVVRGAVNQVIARFALLTGKRLALKLLSLVERMSDRDLAELRALLPNCLRQDRLRLERLLARCHPGVGRHEASAESIGRLIAAARRSIEVRHLRHERVPQVSYPPNLPITARKDEIVTAIRRHPVVIIAGETGSGKTTQIPKMCLEAGLGVEGKIGCTQPRRVAALSIARRIAEELGVRWGEEVGSKIRFTDRSSPLTYIKLMTDGILLAETQADRELNEYDAIVIDEAHERSLNIDFLLGHLKLLLRRRPELKLIVTSATIDTEAFSAAFDRAPIIEVSGRTYPVEVRYAPHDPEAEETGELTYIDAAVAATETALLESDAGDILIFMPSERDIRETVDDLQGRYSSEAEVVPLYGRLSSGEQDRVFAPTAQRKIIVATNIAETSLTIPGVRYVIDTGLARISRYSPRSRTKRLPIEPISQNSARQRAGRSGRVQNGVCIRLYSEEDLLERPKETQPEIQRANLAEVILKMKAWRLGEMETFPFLNPPQPQAVQSGYQLLQELGALDSEKELTPLGRDLARLPVDPSIGRMILQSVEEGAREEVLIVAAGLSIQDPRERPADQQTAADQAHRQFLDPRSDFRTLLNIWNAYDAKLEAFKTQNQMRRFCRANFLNFSRMREWIDVHAQLHDALETLDRGPRSSGQRTAISPATPPVETAKTTSSSRGQPHRRHHAEQGPVAEDQERYAALHRSILSGLLGHIGQKIERNVYRVSGNRQIMVWPGSTLFERPERSKPKDKAAPGGAGESSRQPAWVVSGEIVETSRLFGRTLAGLDPDWIVELGAHLCKRSYGEPVWDRRSGRVLARERITLFGLEVREQRVDYGRVNAQEATELFIRRALVEEDIDASHRFLEHNRKLRERLGVWRTQHREHRLPPAEDALFEFYARHLENISSVHDLNRVLRERLRVDLDFLCASEGDLTGGATVAWDNAAFPAEVRVAEHSARVEYAYAPGEERDGVTVKLPFSLAQRVNASMLDWVVPGLRAEQIESLLKALPKQHRVALMPIAPKVKELAEALNPEAGLEGLRALIQQRYGLNIPAAVWDRDALPSHLRPRIAITGKDEEVLAVGRDLQSLKQGLEKHETSAEREAWTRCAQQWEQYDLSRWTFGDPPESITATEVAGAPLCAFPGLHLDGSSVHLKLFRKREEAAAATKEGFVRLVEIAQQKELAWVQKDLRAVEKFKDLLAGLVTTEELLGSAYSHLRRYLIPAPAPSLPLRLSQFEAAVGRVKTLIPGLVPQFLDRVGTILRARWEIVHHRAYPSTAASGQPALLTELKQLTTQRSPAAGTKTLPFLREELDWLVPRQFLDRIRFEQLSLWPRYLKALQIRADRALLNPFKDAEKAKQVRPYIEQLRQWPSRLDATPWADAELNAYRILLEEFKVSVFAQELGTAVPVSAKRLDAQWQKVQQEGR
jgi:ATP-dependent helicase HrpA